MLISIYACYSCRRHVTQSQLDKNEFYLPRVIVDVIRLKGMAKFRSIKFWGHSNNLPRSVARSVAASGSSSSAAATAASGSESRPSSAPATRSSGGATAVATGSRPSSAAATAVATGSRPSSSGSTSGSESGAAAAVRRSTSRPRPEAAPAPAPARAPPATPPVNQPQQPQPRKYTMGDAYTTSYGSGAEAGTFRCSAVLRKLLDLSVDQKRQLLDAARKGEREGKFRDRSFLDRFRVCQVCGRGPHRELTDCRFTEVSNLHK